VRIGSGGTGHPTLAINKDNFDGKKFLDVGTAQQHKLYDIPKEGFRIVGSDLSEVTINRARKIYTNEGNVNFIVDARFERE
jgi:2-polyprenyl-3-methyl-5-hydroxy-6-metoxy-1,4-benzoquinol methylase